jgi:hypothetical protein
MVDLSSEDAPAASSHDIGEVDTDSSGASKLFFIIFVISY